MTDWPTTKLRWLGSVRGPLFLPELRHIPPPNTPLMITSQHPPRIVIQTLKRSWNGRAWEPGAEMPPATRLSACLREQAGEEPPLTVNERARLRKLERETRELRTWWPGAWLAGRSWCGL